LRNRAEIELICQLLMRKPTGARVDIAVVGCSKGAEVYSLLWAIRRRRRDLCVTVNAIDVSQKILDFAGKGIYSISGVSERNKSNCEVITRSDVTWDDQPMSMFYRLAANEVDEIFEVSGSKAIVRDEVKQGIKWTCADANDPDLLAYVGLHDCVIANRFLCHMQPREAELCLRTVSRLVKPGGYLVVSGVDLDVRTKVAAELGWKPIATMIRETHEGDPTLVQSWPLSYWAIEPFSTLRPDWQIRFASFFQIGSPGRCNDDSLSEASPTFTNQTFKIKALSSNKRPGSELDAPLSIRRAAYEELPNG